MEIRITVHFDPAADFPTLRQLKLAGVLAAYERSGSGQIAAFALGISCPTFWRLLKEARKERAKWSEPPYSGSQSPNRS